MKRATKQQMQEQQRQHQALTGLLLASIQDNDTAKARAYARELHKLETTIAIWRLSSMIYHTLLPFRIITWAGTGAAIGTLLMLIQGVNQRLNMAFLVASVMLVAIAEFIILSVIRIGAGITRTVASTARRMTEQRVALIIERHKKTTTTT